MDRQEEQQRINPKHHDDFNPIKQSVDYDEN